MGGRVSGLGFVLATMAVGASAAGCGHLKQFSTRGPDPIRYETPAVHQGDDERLTRRSEWLSRVAPFVGTAPSDAILVDLQLPQRPEPPRTTEGTIASPALAGGADYAILGSTGQIPLTPGLFDKLLLDYRDDRVLQINRLCTEYFTKLGEIAGNVDYTTSLVNIGGDYATVLLGLAGAPAKQLAVLAGGQAAFNQSVDATRALMLLNPAPSTVHSLVYASQRRLLTDTAVSTTPTHAGVESQIQAYALACTPIGIRAIVNDAVTQKAREEDPQQTSPAAHALLARLTDLFNAGQGETGKVAAMDEQAAAALLWLHATPNCRSAADCETFKAVQERYPTMAAAYGRVKDMPELTTTLNALVVAAPAVAGRRDLMQSNLVNANAEAVRVQMDARIKSLEGQLRTAQASVTQRETRIHELENDARARPAPPPPEPTPAPAPSGG